MAKNYSPTIFDTTKTLELLSQLPNSEFVFLDENYARVFVWKSRPLEAKYFV